MSWGNANTLAGFKKHVLREEYGTFKLTADESDGRLLEGLHHFILRLYHEWALLVCLILPGMLSLCRRAGTQRWFAVTSLSSVVFYLITFHYLANIELHNKPDQQNIVRRFWLMPFIVSTIYHCRPHSCSRPSQILSPILGHGFHVASSYLRLNTVLTLSLVLAAAAVWVSSALPKLDQSLNDFTAQLGRVFLDPLPAGALLLLMSDSATNSVGPCPNPPGRCSSHTALLELLTLRRSVSCKRWRRIAPTCLCWTKTSSAPSGSWRSICITSQT